MLLKAIVLLALAAPGARAGEFLIHPERQTVTLSSAGLRLDDYYFDRTLKLLVVPAGASLDFVDPVNSGVSSMAGFSDVTSVDGAGGVIFAAERGSRTLDVIDGRKRRVLARAPLASEPDYVRYAAAARELWVSEPGENRIEVFSLAPSSASFAVPVSSGFVTSTSGGFESLVVDPARGRAYSNQDGSTVAVDLKSRRIVDTWPNSCQSSSGLALDESRGFLVVACREGLAVVLDVAREGRQLSSLAFGEGIDIVALSPETSRLFLPGARSGTMAFVALSNEGKLSLLGQVETAKGAHCVAADEAGGAWVCDPRGGRLLRFTDRFAADEKTRY